MRSSGSILTSKVTVFVALAFLNFAVLGICCSAQDSGNASSRLSPTECRASDGENIAIKVVVADKSGHPVTGLEAADFKVFDNKQQQKVLAFRAVDKAHPPAVPLSVQIIIDAVNSDAGLVAQERDGVSTFLKQNSGELEYPTSIWIFESSGLKQIGGPTQNRTALLTAVNNQPLRLRFIDRSAGVWGDLERNLQATTLVKKVISLGSGIPGRKLVLFISPGWPSNFDPKPDQRKLVFDDVVEISNGLRESCISLYTLDPSSFANTFQRSGSVSRSNEYESFLKPATKSGDAHYGDLSLQVLSEHSGGQVIIEGNNVEGGINAALQNAAGWYDLVFRRAPGGRTTEYRAIMVTVDKPHVKVHTIAGYYVSGP